MVKNKLHNKWYIMKRQASKNKVAYAFLLPYMIVFTTFTVLPVILSIFYGFTYYNILEPAKFIGIDNYVDLFLSDDIFIKAVKNTFIFAVITGPAGYVLSLLVAWLINELNPKIRAIFVLMFYAPSISGNAYMIWKLIFSSDAYGYLNAILMNLGILSAPVEWLKNERYTLGIVIFVSIWMSLGTSFLSFIAGLQGVDKSLYESGALDGIKNRWQELWYITLPSIRPQMMFAAVLSITNAFAVSDVSINLAGFPSVKYSAHTVVTHLMDYGNTRFEMGYASAIATILFVVMVLCNKLVNKFIKKVGT